MFSVTKLRVPRATGLGSTTFSSFSQLKEYREAVVFYDMGDVKYTHTYITRQVDISSIPYHNLHYSTVSILTGQEERSCSTLWQRRNSNSVSYKSHQLIRQKINEKAGTFSGKQSVLLSL